MKKEIPLKKKNTIITIIILIAFILFFIMAYFTDKNNKKEEVITPKLNMEEIREVLKSATHIKICNYKDNQSNCQEENLVKDITVLEEVAEYVDIITDATIWDGGTTLPSLEYMMELYNNDKLIAVVEFYPIIKVIIEGHIYTLRNKNLDTIKEMIETKDFSLSLYA